MMRLVIWLKHCFGVLVIFDMDFELLLLHVVQLLSYGYCDGIL